MFIALGVSLVIFLVSAFVLAKHGRSIKNASLVLMLGLMVVPFIVKAIEEIELKVNVNVEIKPMFSVSYSYGESKIFSAAEYVSIDKDEYSCRALYYNEVTDEINQYYCYHIVYIEDPELYSYGETITVKGFEIGKMGYGMCRNYTDYLVCEDDAWEEDRMDFWMYHPINGEKDKVQMSIKDENGDSVNVDVEDIDWDFGEGYTFKMPAHDVHFSEPLR